MTQNTTFYNTACAPHTILVKEYLQFRLTLGICDATQF